MQSHSTQVAIIGAGPAGLLLSQMLHQQGVSSIVIEQQTREYVLGRIRAGVLEWGSVEVLRSAGVGERMDREGHIHDGTAIVWGGENRVFLDTKKYTGKAMMAYGQTNITEDLYKVFDERGGQIFDSVSDVQPNDIESASPSVTFKKEGKEHQINCQFIAGCDGFHGVTRPSIPASVQKNYEKVYPFGWLGVLSETKPLPELCYANHEKGFALASMRNPKLSRYYIQCELNADVNDWPDDRFWEELKSRFPKNIADQIVTGPSIEKSIAPLRSFVSEPMSHGRLFLAGDAAHIVPPTGAKGLNLAISDVFYLTRALSQYFDGGRTHYLDNYSDMALRRVWSAERLSWYLTNLLHRFPDQDEFDLRTQEDELRYLSRSEAFMTAICEQYIGLPFED